MSKTIVVLGATGTQGGSVVETYLQKSQWTVRALSRDPSKPAARALAAKGVNVVKADSNDYASLEAAFKGAHMVFAVTDFAAILTDPAIHSKIPEDKSLGEYAQGIELEQGKNIAKAAATTLDTLEIFVWSSLTDMTKWSKGKYTRAYHHNSKAAIWAHIQSVHPALAAKTSLVYLGVYATNWKMGSGFFTPHRLPSPPNTWELSTTFSVDQPMPWVDAIRDTGNIVAGLQEAGPGKTALAISEIMSMKAWMDLWGKVVGVGAISRQGEMTDKLNEKLGGMGSAIQEVGAFYEEFGWTGGDENLWMPKDLGVETTTMEEYMRKEDWSPLLGEK